MFYLSIYLYILDLRKMNMQTQSSKRECDSITPEICEKCFYSLYKVDFTVNQTNVTQNRKLVNNSRCQETEPLKSRK